MTAEFVPDLLPVCTASSKLSSSLYGVITAMGRDIADPYGVETDLRCTLQAHIEGDHQALVVELIGLDSGAAWTTWATGREPSEILVRSDCPTRKDNEVCCSYDGHPGGHTYEITDPWGPLAQAGHQR